MIIIYKESLIVNQFQPVVLIDYTRSDENYSPSEIKAHVKNLKPDAAQFLAPEKIYSVDYTAAFSHEGVVYGDALRTQFTATVKNPPTDLVSLLNVKQIVSNQNLNALDAAVSRVINSQVVFPYGAILFKDPNNLKSKPIVRKFIVFATPITADQRRTQTTLTIRGGGFSDAVMNLNFTISLNRSDTLQAQLRAALEPLGFKVLFNALRTRVPAVAKYYTPKPLAKILQEIGVDNNIISVLGDKVVYFYSASPKEPPPDDIKSSFSFNNSVDNTKLISNFGLNNYVSVDYLSEIFDVELFSSVRVYDDSGSSTLFSNLSSIHGDVKRGFKAYRFYVQGYTLTDSRFETSARVTATNNWLVSVVKLDTLFEAKVYLQNQR